MRKKNLIGKQLLKKFSRDPTEINEKRVNEELIRLMKGGCVSPKTLTALRLQAAAEREREQRHLLR